MLFSSIVKLLIVCATVSAGLVFGSDALLSYNEQSPQQQGVEKRRETQKKEEEESVVKKNNFAIFEGNKPQINTDRLEGTFEVKCMLEGGKFIELCSLSKMDPIPGKKWLDLNDIKKYPFNSHIPDGFINEDDVIYKVRASHKLVDEWVANKHKKLNIFNAYGMDKDTKPLTTLIPKFAIRRNLKFAGSSRYMIGNVQNLTDAEGESAESLNVGEKTFACSSPAQTNKDKKCKIYVFGEKRVNSFGQNLFKTPLTPATTINKGMHYLIEYEGEVPIYEKRYNHANRLIVGEPNTDEITSEMHLDHTEIRFTYLSHAVLFQKYDNIDVLLVI